MGTKFKDADRKIQTLLKIDIANETSWLKLSREALMTSMEEVANRMGISKNSYFQIEKNESTKKVTLLSLKNAAEALDCELIYFIRSKNRQKFSVQIWNKLMNVCLKSPYYKTMKPGKRIYALASHAHRVLRDPKFRRQYNLIKILKD